MPSQHMVRSRETYAFSDDFPRRLELFKRAPGLSSPEMVGGLGTLPHTARRWTDGRSSSNTEHVMGLLELADSLGLDHLLIDWNLMGDAQSHRPQQTVPPRRRG